MLILNEKEACTLAGTTKLAHAVEWLKKVMDFFVITLGKRGSVMYRRPSFTHIPSGPVRAKVVDTTGAGDVFAGAFLAGILRGKSSEESIELAHLQANQSVSHLGPRIAQATCRPRKSTH